MLKIEIREFPSVFECSRVLIFAINPHEIICLQPLSLTVRAEVIFRLSRETAAYALRFSKSDAALPDRNPALN